MPRTYNDELQYLEKVNPNTWRIKKGFVPNMNVSAAHQGVSESVRVQHTRVCQCKTQGSDSGLCWGGGKTHILLCLMSLKLGSGGAGGGGGATPGTFTSVSTFCGTHVCSEVE